MIRSINKIISRGQLHLIPDNPATFPKNSVKRVLVVDDSITIRQMEQKILESHGYQVEVAVDGMEGYNAVITADYDLGITDFDMPIMNGIELVEKIKNYPKLKLIHTIIMCYKDQEEERLRGLEVGANYYLTKIFTIRHFYKR